ncbi:MAG TPA: glutamine-hydrolyzing carbamoyl-phosphate synthase small subunit [Candidatus Deferrimicrobiaceae bacterium]|nr:glutamine-hydrolyzing carbamoyl-phosphate synthase small subunit [Candidatus Deferrimicrobiaceae bacterium]
MSERKALLALADGTVYRGTAFGHIGESGGEVVFNTGMTGYQEVLTDPSYKGQMVTMTYPEIGNTGINPEDVESSRPWVEGFIVREVWRLPSNWRHVESLDGYLRRYHICGITGVDTRALTRRLRDGGSQMGVISSVDYEENRLVKKARDLPPIVGRDLVREVTSTRETRWESGDWDIAKGYLPASEYRNRFDQFPRVVAIDYGIKQNILRMLVSHGMEVTVVPSETTASAILAKRPDGVFLSNGPGDPEGVPYAIRTVSELLGKVPVFGICLGHQIMGLALGGKTFKLSFGHHGCNQPVMDLFTGKVEITSQNHNFSVDETSLGDRARVTHVNLNDRTVEGLSVPSLRCFSVQYHPEASPGPHDSRYLFTRFYRLLAGEEEP